MANPIELFHDAYTKTFSSPFAVISDVFVVQHPDRNPILEERGWYYYKPLKLKEMNDRQSRCTSRITTRTVLWRRSACIHPTVELI